MESVRQIIYFKEYFLDFYDSQPEKVKDKIDHVLFVVSAVERIPRKFFDHITGSDGLYEIRVEFQSNIYRIFCCFDDEKIVVLFNAFQKRTQKTPPNEIERALKIKKEYFEYKIKNKKNEHKK